MLKTSTTFLDECIHTPVLVNEVLYYLSIKKGGVYVDATIGSGGHTLAILSKHPEAKIIAIDRDEDALEIAKKRLKGFSVYFIKGAFSEIEEIVSSLGINKVNGILADLGLSKIHLTAEERGFSFLKDEPLDMRMDREQHLTAWHVVNKYRERDLERIFREYSQERYARKIARAIVRARSKKPIQSCNELALLIQHTIGKREKIHPATRVFQAIRIEVNREIEELSGLLKGGVKILKKGGRFCVISYHSVEDRIVKHTFREFAKDGLIKVITKKPIIPQESEISINPSSRSAKLRVAEKIL
ncbi:MAG: 16S rRNA (cytosine(1402)-N(4))-methyltransferase RsmH, partial [Nitrospirae bacterium]